MINSYFYNKTLEHTLKVNNRNDAVADKETPGTVDALIFTKSYVLEVR